MVEADRSSQLGEPDLHFCGFHKLMPHRVENVLLVSRLYESFILKEEGLLNELITSEYLDLSLSHAPRVSRVSTAQEAIEFTQGNRGDVVLTMAMLVQRSLPDFAKAVKEIRPDLPGVVLADEPRELVRHPELSSAPHIDRTFVWSGDPKVGGILGDPPTPATCIITPLWDARCS